MGRMQRQIWAAYTKSRKGYSLRRMSEETGIGITRLFRISHGSEMKLAEYEIFWSKLVGEVAESGGLYEVLNVALQNLDGNFLEDMHKYIERKISASLLLAQ